MGEGPLEFARKNGGDTFGFNVERAKVLVELLLGVFGFLVARIVGATVTA